MWRPPWVSSPCGPNAGKLLVPPHLRRNRRGMKSQRFFSGLKSISNRIHGKRMVVFRGWFWFRQLRPPANVLMNPAANHSRARPATLKRRLVNWGFSPPLFSSYAPLVTQNRAWRYCCAVFVCACRLRWRGAHTFFTAPVAGKIYRESYPPLLALTPKPYIDFIPIARMRTAKAARFRRESSRSLNEERKKRRPGAQDDEAC